MPTSVLLAVLAAAGLLALAPALVRRYDATERLAAERAQSTARVLDRTRRRRTVPIAGRPRYVSAALQIQDDGVRTTTAVGRAVWLQVPRVAEADPGSSDSPRIGAERPPGGSGVAPESRDRDVAQDATRASQGAPAARDAAPATRDVSRAAQAARDAAPKSSVRDTAKRARGGSESGGGSRSTPGTRPSHAVPASPGSAAGNGPNRSTVGRGGSSRQVARKSTPKSRRQRVRQSPAVYRRRRVLALLVVLNVIEVIGITAVSPGFWTGFAVTSLLLVAYVVHLRNASITDARARRVQARRAAVIAAEQAAIRATHAERIAARREALRRAAAARSMAQRDAQRLSQRYVDYDPQRGARVRGRPYEQGGGYTERAAGL